MDLKKRMDRFDSVVVEYKRRHPKQTMSDICSKLGCDPSTLWRYRRDEVAFKDAKFDVICGMLRMANVSNETLRYICGWST